MLYYITSNQEKINVARKYLDPLGIQFEGKNLPLVEIQSEDIEAIALHKANQAFEQLEKPLFVMDAGWNIPALNGFPGPFMKYINDWLSVNDFLNLMKPHQDRSIKYREVFVYKDRKQIKAFIGDIAGTILSSPQGSSGPISWKLVSLHSNGKSIAQCWDEGIDPVDNYPLWEEFARWVKTNEHSLVE